MQGAWRVFCPVTPSKARDTTVLTLEECCAFRPAPQGSSYNHWALRYEGLRENPPAEPLPSIREEAPTTGESQETHGVVLPVKAVSGFRADAQHSQHGGSCPLNKPELHC